MHSVAFSLSLPYPLKETVDLGVLAPELQLLGSGCFRNKALINVK